ncbi:hypothetical protein SHJG_0412 [Streptomyces hygroscopicus subsp. jinggangensis 5008]|nr:hypothetical protein SHJG_0412 [Streptomyces hygroscopicus subsp. jinggangensis 5008]AGF59912.1 hypothetical protein SHJGH_0246 [Streptomyces hygroscopicus subsp. jinggangensis TL01]
MPTWLCLHPAPCGPCNHWSPKDVHNRPFPSRCRPPLTSRPGRGRLPGGAAPITA